MSKASQDAIAANVLDLVNAVTAQDEPKVAGALQWLATRALCDLNRIADALETLAAPPNPTIGGPGLRVVDPAA